MKPTKLVLRIQSDLSRKCWHDPIELAVPTKMLKLFAKHNFALQVGLPLFSNAISSVPVVGGFLQGIVDVASGKLNKKIEDALTIHNCIADAGIQGDAAVVVGTTATNRAKPSLLPDESIALLVDLLKMYDSSFTPIKISKLTQLERGLVVDVIESIENVESRKLLKTHSPRPLDPPMTRSSVEDAWEEMQRETSVRASDVTRLLRKSMASTSSTTHKTKLSTQKEETGRVSQEPFSFARELNRLADERPNIRKQAATALEVQLLNDNDEAPLLPDGTAFSDMAKPLFKRFNDPVEKVRDVCIRLTCKFLPLEPDLLRVLPYLIPAVANRIDSHWGYDEEQQVFTRDQFLHDAFKRGRVLVAQSDVARLTPNEPSEEIRLRFLELLATLVDETFRRHAASLLHAYVFDFLLILVAGLHDDFHDINIRACAILEVLCSHMVSVMKHFTVGFVRATTHLLVHRLARVRVAAVTCVQALVACPNFEKCKGSGTEAIVDLLGHRDENVIPIAAFYTGDVRLNYFAKLDQDANPLVRAAFYGLIQDWILNLPDRYDHESRLMPYLLSAVSDELDDISKRAQQTLATLGTRYEQEHGEEVLELKQYGVDGKNPSYNYTKRLPEPFGDAGPSLGTRLYVRSRTRRFLHPVLRELANWQSPTRAHAVRLLKCVLVYSEETITGDAHVLLQTLLKTWDAEARENVVQFREIADLVGRFVEPKTYAPLLLARIRGEEDLVGTIVSAESLAAALEVLACVLGGSLDRTVLPHVPEIVETLTCDHVLAFETPRVQTAQISLASQVTSLLQRRGRDAVSAYFLEHGRLTNLERVLDRLFEVAVALSAATADAAVVEQAIATLSTLSDIEINGSLPALYDVRFRACFARAATRVASRSAIQWKPQALDQLVIDQLVQHITPAFFQQSPECVAQLTAHFHAMLSDTNESEDAGKSTASRERHYQSLLLSLRERLGTPMNNEDAWQPLLAIASRSSTAIDNATAA